MPLSMTRIFLALLGAVLFVAAARAQEQQPPIEKPTRIVRDLSRPTAGSVTVYYGNQTGGGQFGGKGGGGFGGGKGGGKGGGQFGGMGGGNLAPLTPDCPIPWNVRSTQLQGGRQDGVHVIYLNNGKLTIAIVPTRGMGSSTSPTPSWKRTTRRAAIASVGSRRSRKSSTPPS